MALPVALLVTCALSACGAGDKPVSREQTATHGTATAPGGKSQRSVVSPRHTEDGCAPVAAARPRPEQHLRKPRRRLNRRHRYVATLRTNCGTIAVKLAVRHFPKTTRSFIRLARAGFYDGLSFHRIAKPGGNDFVIQGGDPQGNGDGGPGYSVVERPPHDVVYPVGTVAMAKANDEKPGTSGSQFFIVTGSGAALDPLYAIIGRVSVGSAVVRRIAAVPADPVTEMPIDPVIVKKVTIRESRS